MSQNPYEPSKATLGTPETIALPPAPARWPLALRYWTRLCVLLNVYSLSLPVAVVVSEALGFRAIDVGSFFELYFMRAPVFAFWLGILLLVIGVTYNSLFQRTRVPSWLLITTAVATIVAFASIPRFIT